MKGVKSQDISRKIVPREGLVQFVMLRVIAVQNVPLS